MRETINLKGALAEARELSEKFDLYMNEKELQELANDLDPDAPRPLANEYDLTQAHYIAAVERDGVALAGRVVNGVTLSLADGELVADILREQGTSLAECSPEQLSDAVAQLDEFRYEDEPDPEENPDL